MAEIGRLSGTNGVGKKSKLTVKSQAIARLAPIEREAEDNTASALQEIEQQNSETKQQQQQPVDSTGAVGKKVVRYYIDELGFYRHLDPDQRQYVCSNLNSAILKSGPARVPGERVGSNKGGDGGYEICFTAIRHELGISHFDKTVGYEQWKRGWDDFMRAKLIKQEPVTMNRELKNRVRSGIPHDYRCKVWSALIRMRTRNLRQTNNDESYQKILTNYVSKFEVPEYLSSPSSSSSSSSSNNGDEDLNNNPSNKHKKRANRIMLPSQSAPIQVNLNSMQDSRTHLRERNNAENKNSNNRLPISNLNPEETLLIEKSFKQIELDLLRTLPNNRHFEDPNSRGIQRVRRVLRAYSCFNQTVGYCQGMNRLAAMALLVLPEEEAFWCLVAIIQCIMPKDYYLKPWLAQVDCCVLSDLLEKKMPKLHKHLVVNDIQLTLFTWFFTIFVDGFRPELMLRIWDCFLLEGDKVLFRFALAILHISQDDLLEMSDFSTMSSHLSRLVSTRRLDMEHLFETFNTMNPLSSATLEARRAFHRNRMQSVLGV